MVAEEDAAEIEGDGEGAVSILLSMSTFVLGSVNIAVFVELAKWFFFV